MKQCQPQLRQPMPLARCARCCLSALRASLLACAPAVSADCRKGGLPHIFYMAKVAGGNYMHVHQCMCQWVNGTICTAASLFFNSG